MCESYQPIRSGNTRGKVSWDFNNSRYSAFEYCKDILM
jgi:hypothetical protein